ncbi:MAG: tyrosine-type recombinase/integrase [Crocinitomicaceae bacterium]|nr:tyrosine-type recombinase/integrase [Crocinitomicaceae bacterium]
MEQMRAEEILYKGKPVIGIYFPYNNQLIQRVKKIEGVRWSTSQRGWFIDSNEIHCQKLLSEFPELEIKRLSRNKIPACIRLSDEKNSAIEKFVRFMQSKRYATATVKTYTECVRAFLAHFENKKLEDFNEQDLIAFNHEYILSKKLSNAYQNQVVNAVKLFFKGVNEYNFKIELIHRPRREHRLPNVLNKMEVKTILDACRNLKHRAMLSLIYACGLRRSELLNLKLDSIDSKRKLLFIKQAKGKKDRMVPLSEKIIQVLRDYYLAFKPKAFLFEGQAGGKYSETSLESVLKQAVKKAGIIKPVSLHWLRHSYATHLLESGTDLRYIQELLGHSSSRTTEIYTHVSTQNIEKIKSPFDDL